jgi:hypothetical protein
LAQRSRHGRARAGHRRGAPGRGRLGKLIAVLDAQAGAQYEGIDPPQQTEADWLAIAVWNLLTNGHGGIDWAGLPYAVALHGVTDLAGLITRLQVIKLHKPPEQRGIDPHNDNLMG